MDKQPVNQYFQLAMPGDTCFGCGTENNTGLQIKSYWEEESETADAICKWQAKDRHQGWQNLTCGGILSTIIDCHCMATAMATAIRNEKRAIDSNPKYLFATGSLSIKFLQPAPLDQPLLFRARVVEIKNDKKYSLHCEAFVEAQQIVEAQVTAFLVFRSDRPEEANPCFVPS